MKRYCRFHWTILLITTLLCSSSYSLSCETPVFKIYLERNGVYGVTYEQLADQGLKEGIYPSNRIGLISQNKKIPILINDGDDGFWGPGDSFMFIGENLIGENSYLNEFSRYNCYFLTFDASDPKRILRSRIPKQSKQSEESIAFDAQQHLEQDLTRLRFRHQPGEQQEAWYWRKLVHNQTSPVEQAICLEGLDRSSKRPVRLRIGLRGWSIPANKMNPGVFDHKVAVSFDDKTIGSRTWNGPSPVVFEFDLDAQSFTDHEGVLQLNVPSRKEAKNGEILIDVVMLNWIEITYPHSGAVGPTPTRLLLRKGDEVAKPKLYSSLQQPLRVLTASAGCLESQSGEIYLNHGHGPWVWALGPEQYLNVDAIVQDEPSQLRSTLVRADYIMICHQSLVEAVAPLADLHRRRGLSVLVVDVQDVFDEFSSGVIDPKAIRSFLQHAYDSWLPTPRFVLLVGDASWDFKNLKTDDESYADWTYRPGERLRFSKNTSIPYSLHPESNYRNLVPTWGWGTFEGQAAADTWFVCLSGDDDLPDMAIGRFPVVDPEEVRDIVAKTIAFIEEPELGPWRRNFLFITDENPGLQKESDRIAMGFLTQGYAPIKIYPRAAEVANQEHTEKIINAMDNGILAIHFIGHGGRYIWRTGPPDLKKNHDLFTLDHLERLQASRRLPVVLSLTCYSAPFDHPNADSIGEKLLRLPGSGAIAVLAASWRNLPSAAMGRIMLEELTRPSSTIGEAIMRGKQRIHNPLLVQTYNLLGDPAVPTAAPAQLSGLEISRSHQKLTLKGSAPSELIPAKALIELIGSDLQVLHRREILIRSTELEVGFVVAAEEIGDTLGARIYCWSEAKGRDAIGWGGVDHRH